MKWFPVSASVPRSTAAVISSILALTFTGCQAVCDNYGSRLAAEIGKNLTLQCTVNCYSLQYKWISVTESANITLENETRDTLNITTNVTSVGEVGGKLYECQCVSGGCLLFRIGVKPVGHLFFSTKTIKTGGTVNITCKAEGYPSDFSFKVTHENDQIQTTPLAGGRGVYFVIESASKTDFGEYACFPEATLQEYPNDPLQGNAAIDYLTVYDPPFISCTDNDTVVCSHEEEQTAVLECAVDNREDWLNVSISWTTTDDKEITAPHTVVEGNNVSYLLLHKISNWTNNDYLYTCKVFSKFGLEDQSVLQVIFSDPACSNTTCPDTAGGDDKDLYYKYFLIPTPVLTFVVGLGCGLTVQLLRSYVWKNFLHAYFIKFGIQINESAHNILFAVKEK